MKRYLVFIFMLISVIAYSITIYDIQYTEIQGDGTYPSLYIDQMVTITGIVTCNNYGGDKFFISMPEGGAWKGILVYHATDELSPGDEVQITAEVTEYYGLTELQNVVNISILSTGNTIPEPVEITTHQLNTLEEYEGVLVKINDAQVVTEPDQYDIYLIDDGSGACQIGINCLPLDDYYFELLPGIEFNSITGCGIYSWGSYELTPRFAEDIVLNESELRISISDHDITESSQFAIPIQVFAPAEGIELTSFSFYLNYNSSILQLEDISTENSLLQGTEIIWNSEIDQVSLNWNDDVIVNSNGILCFLHFLPLEQGSTHIAINDFILNGETFENYQNGDVTYHPIPGIIADELTIIQKPILAIPQITYPGSSFEIICLAEENTSNWNAELQYEDIVLPLEIFDTQYNPETSLYTLSVNCPIPQIYTLYDLKVTADAITEDIAENAVSIIPEYKDNYYFVHITDTHLPGHEFFGNDPSGEDFTEIEDLRHVIETVNLINPEFVLLTGDVVNEGELQDFNGRYQYSRAKNLIREFEVPVYITSGNHDLGGWNDTDPPPGSARHNWRRFFGWEYLENGVDGTYTQNYHFTYDNTLFIGLEAYDNYDSYLYNIFGDSSFTAGQMTWLQEIIASSNAETKVAFYHFDFDDELDLSSLGLDMALWGHNHSNTGNINQYPYNLSTKAVCDENRAFRTIFVEDNQLIPQNTSYAQNYPDISFAYPNNGNYDNNSVTIFNDYSLNFYNSKLVFALQPASDYTVDYGNIDYIIDHGAYKEVAVTFSLLASESITINISPINQQTDDVISSQIVLNTYPNPANPDINIEYYLTQTTNARIDIYNIKGQHIENILDSQQSAGNQKVTYKANALSSGIYFIKVQTQNSSALSKVVLLK